ncbi:MAG TPA: dTDP-4-amino-4,6-dideoxygalactose transaminase [Anaerolineaceae bacterium]|jgi:dTDP-4-amino-4,6-dideoxygalactose transaminase|nr:dTDP-4-amino-4,6-dideoxygalactose transaminase [Anaerolineaceae bacterium]HOE35203.1 dTDP-4-amino-4,6-dideoxygalactose transaminase [Anaerolineaceae bacterium]HOT26131.1 dTDP-4-amino-4,6-dideoxygalactose transaminase [Anaerolineaceae bacterium]HQH58329.1 dTDP-4-amino-4,6-dideoxygalactose transaminase [Anaerolineaceae bacterium]
MSKIPFNKPPFLGSELDYMRQAIASGHLSGDGDFTRRCSAALEQLIGAPKVLLTTSCTHALEMAALLLNIQPGDEVIFPSFTFVSTVNAFVLRGAKPVFADIHPDTLDLDETQLERLLRPRTRAVVPVHYAGVGCEMDPILDFARQNKLEVVEDNAHGLTGKYKDKALGSFGSMATQSFHETKNFSCGEGGALVINDPRYIERAEIIREKGTNRSRFFRGMVDKYTWVDIGSSYLPSDMLAAYLCAQLEQWQTIQARRKQIWEKYDAALRDWAARNGVRQPFVPADREQTYHMYYLLFPGLAQRQEFIARLKAREILSVFHYLPLHLSDMGQRFGGKPGDCPVTERVSDQLVRLPLFYNLTDEEQDRVIEVILSQPV